jgi:hypothetical protein
MAEPTKWEYKLVSIPLARFDDTDPMSRGRLSRKVVEFSETDPVQGAMNEWGASGWELHSMVQRSPERLILIFKRPQAE